MSLHTHKPSLKVVRETVQHLRATQVAARNNAIGKVEYMFDSLSDVIASCMTSLIESLTYHSTIIDKKLDVVFMQSTGPERYLTDFGGILNGVKQTMSRYCYLVEELTSSARGSLDHASAELTSLLDTVQTSAHQLPELLLYDKMFAHEKADIRKDVQKQENIRLSRISSNYEHLVLARGSTDLEFWSTKQRVPTTYFYKAHDSEIQQIEFSKDSNQAISYSKNQQLKVWSANGGGCKRAILLPTDITLKTSVLLTYVLDDQAILLASCDQLLLWNTAYKDPSPIVNLQQQQHHQLGSKLTLHPDTMTLACQSFQQHGGKTSEVRFIKLNGAVVNTEEGEVQKNESCVYRVVKKLVKSNEEILDVSFSSSRDMVIIAVSDEETWSHYIELYALSSLRLLRRIEVPGSFKYFDQLGIRGVIVVCTSDDQFYAIDLRYGRSASVCKSIGCVNGLRCSREMFLWYTARKMYWVIA